MRERLRIGVVGCGIAGTAFALLARRAGHDVDLYERTDHVGPVGAGVLLQPSGQRVLRDMGLLEQVTARAEVIHEIHAVTHRGRDLIRLRYADGMPGSFAFGLHRGDLFTALHRALLAEGIRLHLGVSIESHEQSADEIHLTDAIGAARGPFDLVVAADGGRSRLRESRAIRYKSTEYDHGALWAVGATTAVRNKLLQVTCGTARLCGLLPMGDRRCSLFWGMRRDEYERLARDGAWESWRADVLRLAPAAAEVLATICTPRDVVFTTFRHTTMPRWHDGRLLFIGDAAHATGPHLGQGVNLALIDAQSLAAAIEREPTIPAAFVAYTRARRPQLRFYSTLTGCLTPFFQSDGRLKGIARDLVLPHVSRIPPIKRLMLTTLRGDVFAPARERGATPALVPSPGTPGEGQGEGDFFENVERR